MNEIKPGMPQLVISQEKPTNAKIKPAMDDSGIEINHHLQNLANMMLVESDAAAALVKVDDIKSRISSGKYEINIDELTNKLYDIHFSTQKSNSR